MSQTKEFKKEIVLAATGGDTDENSPLVLEHAGPWTAEGKYQERKYVLREIATGDFYRHLVSRSGSPFTDYTYSWEWENDMIVLVQAHKITKTIEVWE